MITKTFADFAAQLSYEKLPDEAVSAARKVFMDWLGNAYAGAGTRTGQIIQEVVAESGGNPEASLIGFKAKSNALNAALVNGGISHIVEFDDIYKNAIYHPGAPTIAAALAVAEKLKVDGKRLITGIVAGYEVSDRIGEALQPSHYRFWHTTGTIGTFGAAAAAGNILGLNQEQMLWAMGSAGTMAAGLWQFLDDGQLMTKPLHPGRAASNGVLAALLAKKDFNGATRILEGEKGFGKAMSTDWGFDRVMATLGKEWLVAQTTFKAYAACGHTHPTIDCILALKKDHGVTADDVEKVRVRTYGQAYTVCNNPTPVTTYQAKFSLQYTAAIALRFGLVGTAEFAQERIGDPETAAVMRKITVEADPELTPLAPAKRPAIVEITTKNGQTFTHRVDYRKGDPENPPTLEELQNKFRDLASATLPKADIEPTIEAVSGLERMEDVSKLIRR